MATSIVKTPQKVESESPPMIKFTSNFVYNYYKLWNIKTSYLPATVGRTGLTTLASRQPGPTRRVLLILDNYIFWHDYISCRYNLISFWQLYISVAHTDYFILNQPALPTCSRRGKNEVRYVLRIGPEGGRVFFIILYQSYEHFKYQTNRGRWNLFLICLQFLFLYLE